MMRHRRTQYSEFCTLMDLNERDLAMDASATRTYKPRKQVRFEALEYHRVGPTFSIASNFAACKKLDTQMKKTLIRETTVFQIVQFKSSSILKPKEDGTQARVQLGRKGKR